MTVWTTNIQPAAIAMPSSRTTSGELNQSLSGPRSSMNWSEPTVIDSSAKPRKSKRRKRRTVSGMKKKMPASAAAPIGTLM